MPHCSSEHEEEQFESMVGGAGLSATAMDEGGAAEETNNDAGNGKEDYDKDVLFEKATNQIDVVVGSSLAPTVNRDSSEYKQALNDVKSGVVKDVITRLRVLTWNKFIHVMKLGFHLEDRKWKDRAKDDDEYNLFVLKHKPEGFILIRNPVIQLGKDGDTGVDLLDKMTDNVINVARNMVIDGVTWLQQDSITIYDYTFNLEDIKDYFKRFYLGNISPEFVETEASVYNNLFFKSIVDFNLDEFYRALKIWMSAFFNVYKKQIYGAMINSYINSLKGLPKNPIYKLLIIKIILKFCKKKAGKFANEMYRNSSLAHSFFSIYLNIFKYTYDKINTIISTGIYNSAQAIANNPPSEEEKNEVIELLQEKAEMMGDKIDEDLIESVQETIGDFRTKRSGGAPKRTSKKHTKKGKTKMLKGKSKKHLKKAKKGKKTGKKVRFHSSSKKSKKSTRKRH